MLVAVAVLVGVGVFVGMRMRMGGIVGVGEMDIEFHAGDAVLLAAGVVEVELIETELGEFRLEGMPVDAQVEQGADEHIAAHAAEQVQVKLFHDAEFEDCSWARALIWLAA